MLKASCQFSSPTSLLLYKSEVNSSAIPNFTMHILCVNISESAKYRKSSKFAISEASFKQGSVNLQWVYVFSCLVYISVPGVRNEVILPTLECSEWRYILE